MNNKTSWWLYILKLEGEKWYVGITSKPPEERFREHKLHIRGAYWTMEHKPISIELTEDLGVVSKAHAEKYENKVTRSLMKERGINNVRGGDLRDTAEYVIRFGYVIDKESWNNLLYGLTALALFFVFWLDKYVIAFIPGGIR